MENKETIKSDGYVSAVNESNDKSDKNQTSINVTSPKETIDDEDGYFTKKIKLLNTVTGKRGTFLSFILIICVMIASIIAQKYAKQTSFTDIWLNSCPNGYDDVCKGNGAVYRFSFALVIVYVIQLVGSLIHVEFFDNYWTLKVLGYIGLVVGFYYSTSNVFDANGYAWFARIAAFFYVILQQIILIDFAYSKNEMFLELASQEESGQTLSNKWLLILLLICFIIYGGSISAIGVMYWQFSGCDSNNIILSLTLCVCILATLFQLFISENGTLLTSSIITGYCTYITYSAITLNPDTSCNPTLSSNYQTLSTAIGLALTVVSLTWSTSTAINKIPSNTSAKVDNSNPIIEDNQSAKKEVQPILKNVLAEVSVVFILASTYYAMVLTNWATLQSNYNISSPRQGQAAMWLQASAIWVALSLYVWTLVAPKLFPDRDFS